MDKFYLIRYTQRGFAGNTVASMGVCDCHPAMHLLDLMKIDPHSTITYSIEIPQAYYLKLKEVL